MRARRSDAELERAAETIVYEFDQFVAALQLMDRASGESVVDQPLHNAGLESALIHARNLRDFFQDSGNPDDIMARDFTSTVPNVSMPTLGSKDISKRLNKRLAHPSYKRHDLNRDWPLTEIAEDVARGMKTFLEQLEDERPHLTRSFERVARLIEKGPT